MFCRAPNSNKSDVKYTFECILKMLNKGFILLQMEVLLEIQEEIWRVVNIWRQECRVAMESTDLSNETSILDTSTMSTDSFTSSFVTDTSHDTSSGYSAQCDTDVLNTSSESHTFTLKESTELEEESKSESSGKLHSGPVMAAVSFFNSMTQVLSKSRNQKSASKSSQNKHAKTQVMKNRNQTKGSSVKSDYNENVLVNTAGGEITVQQQRGIQTDHTAHLTRQQHVKSSHLKRQGPVTVEKPKKYQTYSTVPRHTMSEDKYGHTDKTSADHWLRPRARTFGSSNVDFLFEPRTVYEQVRKPLHKSSAQINGVNQSLDPTGQVIGDEIEPGFKRTQSVPEQMNLQFELWNNNPVVVDNGNTMETTRAPNGSAHSENIRKKWKKTGLDLAAKSYTSSTINQALKDVTTSEDFV